MPKLYYSSTSCGAASFIAAVAAGVHFEAETVDLKTHKTSIGNDFYSINDKGNVPTLVLDDGTVLNEGAAVLQYIADQKPGTIAPIAGTIERYLNIAALNYIASEVHPSLGALFRAPDNPDVKAYLVAQATRRLDYLERLLDKMEFLGRSSTPTIADFYLYVVLSWVPGLGLSLERHAKVNAYFERMAALDVVKKAQERMANAPLAA